jgi:hypothetical protein
MAEAKPDTSRFLDGKQKQYDARRLSSKRAISYAQINQTGGDSHV